MQEKNVEISASVCTVHALECLILAGVVVERVWSRGRCLLIQNGPPQMS